MKHVALILLCLSASLLADSTMVYDFIAPAPGGGGGTSYANAGGSGDRTSIITTSQSTSGIVGGATTLINGVTGANEAYFTTLHGAGYWIKFDFGTAKVIDELKWYQHANYEHGVWNLQGSNDDSSWTPTNDFTLGSSGGSAQVTPDVIPITNTTGYRYYRMIVVSGTTSNSPYIREIEFKIGNP